MQNSVLFGPSGKDITFTPKSGGGDDGYIAWLAGFGLTAYEISFGRGVRLSPKTAEILSASAKKHGIAISAHAPYFVNLASGDKKIVENSYNYIKQSLEILRILCDGGGVGVGSFSVARAQSFNEQKSNGLHGFGGITSSAVENKPTPTPPTPAPMRLVVHTGAQCKLSRERAVKNCEKNLAWVVERLKTDGFENFLLCIETMGRYSQIGNADEIIRLCSVAKNIIPCIDFGHINCIEQGAIQRDPNRMCEILDAVRMAGIDTIHIHFSAIVYTAKGEHTHTTLDDTRWNFDFAPLAKYLKTHELNARVICESKNKMAQDAIKLVDIYNNLC